LAIFSPVGYERKFGCVFGKKFNFKRMANGTLSFHSNAEFDEASWCEAPSPRKQSIRNILGYAAAARSVEIQSVPRFTLVAN
jgi:hypothetical protein